VTAPSAGETRTCAAFLCGVQVAKRRGTYSCLIEIGNQYLRGRLAPQIHQPEVLKKSPSVSVVHFSLVFVWSKGRSESVSARVCGA
jgi:hypothetical protein